MKIVVEKLAKTYRRHVLFRDLRLTFEPGEPVCIWGPNGSGKSTLLKIIAGLVRPTLGSVTYQHESGVLTPQNARHLFGMAAPDVVLYDELTPVENLAFILRMRGLAYSQAAVETCIESFGLGGFAHATVGTFSSGMKQRLRLAASGLHDPGVLLLDEPSSYLDESGTAIVESLVKERWKGRIVVIATNDTREKDWCGSVVTLGD